MTDALGQLIDGFGQSSDVSELELSNADTDFSVRLRRDLSARPIAPPTDTEGESSGRTTVLLSLMVALAVVAVSVIKERMRGGKAVTTAETDTDTDKVSVG